MNVRYRVDLSQTERDALVALLNGGKQPERRLKRMQILLAADAGVSDEAAAVSVQTSGSTIYRTKTRFVEISREAALSKEPRGGSKAERQGQGASGRPGLIGSTRGMRSVNLAASRQCAA